MSQQQNDFRKRTLARGEYQTNESFRMATQFYGKLPPCPDKWPRVAKLYKKYKDCIAEIHARPRPAGESPKDAAEREKMEIDEAFRNGTGYTGELPPPASIGGPYFDYLHQLTQPVPLILFFASIFSF